MLKPLLFPLPILLVMCTSVNVRSQTYEIVKDSSSVKISGSSNLHDWRMDLRSFDCSASFQLHSPELTGIDNAVFKANSTDLKSDNSLMDKKTYAALKSKTNPEIKFTQTQPVKIAQATSSFEANIKGDLEIAGKSNSIAIPIKGTVVNSHGTERINIKGNALISMYSYDVSPPTFMMGVLKTSDKVTVSFSLQFIVR
jgi:polyisoprenoid-binding protein YceI